MALATNIILLPALDQFFGSLACLTKLSMVAHSKAANLCARVCVCVCVCVRNPINNNLAAAARRPHRRKPAWLGAICARFGFAWKRVAHSISCSLADLSALSTLSLSLSLTCSPLYLCRHSFRPLFTAAAASSSRRLLKMSPQAAGERSDHGEEKRKKKEVEWNEMKGALSVRERASCEICRAAAAA